MTNKEAKDLLLKGDIATLIAKRPVGIFLSDIVYNCVDIMRNLELDTVGSKCLSITRHFGETDDQLRERLKKASHYLDSLAFSGNHDWFGAPISIGNLGVPHIPITIIIGCDHKWESYVGLNQKFDYCTSCDEKRET